MKANCIFRGLAASVAILLALALALPFGATSADAKPKNVHTSPSTSQPAPSATTEDEESSSAAHTNVIVGEDDDEPAGASAGESGDGGTPLQTIAELLMGVSFLMYLGLIVYFLLHPKRTWKEVREFLAECNPLKYARTRVTLVTVVIAMTALFSMADQTNLLLLVVYALPYALAASCCLSSKISKSTLRAKGESRAR